MKTVHDVLNKTYIVKTNTYTQQGIIHLPKCMIGKRIRIKIMEETQ